MQRRYASVVRLNCNDFSFHRMVARSVDFLRRSRHPMEIRDHRQTDDNLQ